MSTESTDVVIVGGGVAGVATAYYLGKNGVRATVVERDSIASHASGFAYGGLSPLGGFGIPGPLFDLSRESYRLHMELAETLPDESGVDFQFRKRDSLGLAFTDEEAQSLRRGMEWQAAQPGYDVSWVEPADIRGIDERISSDALGGVLIQGMGEVEPYRFVLALSQAAEKMGATVRHGTAVGLTRDGGRVTGVRLTSGTIRCDRVVLAAGPWSSECGDWLGMPIAVAPLKGQILRLQAAGPPLDCSVGWKSNYATSKPDGLLWAGTTEEEAGMDETPTPEARDRIMASLLRMVPELESAELVRQTACVRPLSGDGLPILGAVPGWEGAFVVTGGGRKGILLGTGMGRVTADLVTRGASDISVDEFDPDRFRPAADGPART